MFLLSFTDYAEELRFYLIHMTEVRDLCERVCVCMHARTCTCGGVKKTRQKQKEKHGLR